MKILKKQIEKDIQRIFNSRLLSLVLISALTLSFYSCTTGYMVGTSRERYDLTPPSWAPDFDNADPANYYYLPDIECYYDVRNRAFVYLEGGNWRFSASLPSIYANFDLHNSFVVVLNNTVNEPWMHFHYYVAHYPRYYYKSVNRYGDQDNNRSARWFNENKRHSGYTNRNENRQVQRSDREQYNRDYNRNNNNTGGNRIENRQSPDVRRNNGNNSGSNRSTTREEKRNDVRPAPDQKQNVRAGNEGSLNREQPMKYYGRQIGQPVKVQKNMRKPQENKGKEKRQEKRER